MIPKTTLRHDYIHAQTSEYCETFDLKISGDETDDVIPVVCKSQMLVFPSCNGQYKAIFLQIFLFR